MLDRKPTLLVIDDDPQLLRLYARLLGREFVIECEAEAGPALRRITSGAAYDVILCDLHLARGISGKAFFELVGDVSPELQRRIVICSGTELAEDGAFASALGDRFFMKPGSIATLAVTLHRVARAAPRAA